MKVGVGVLSGGLSEVCDLMPFTDLTSQAFQGVKLC